MKSHAYLRRFLIALVLPVICFCTRQLAIAAPTNVFFTQFETSEGYTNNFDLVGQGPWTSWGSGGNGILTNFFPGQGQQAYVGFAPPNTNDDVLIVWPTNQFNPVAAGLPLVKFSVKMQIADSSNGEYDYFQWQVYNPQGDQLFVLEFDNYWTNINYLLDGTDRYTNTGVFFSPDVTYSLLITMNFASNRWSASLDNTLLVTNLPITTVNAPLGFGDVDAAWLLFTNTPGNNYMLFDNYRVTAEALTVPPVPQAQVQILRRYSDGWVLLQVSGPDGSRWSLDASTNFVNWTALKTNTITGGPFEYTDMTAPPFARRFYRARLVP